MTGEGGDRAVLIWLVKPLPSAGMAQGEGWSIARTRPRHSILLRAVRVLQV